jgi:hypothetical protein
VAVTLVALVAPAAAQGTLLGAANLNGPSDSSQSCSVNPSCTYIQTKVPGGKAKAPFNGHVRKWRISLGLAGSAQLVVAKRLANGEFKVLRASDVESGVTGVNRYTTDLRIRRGQYTGVSLSDGAAVSQFDDAGAQRRGFVPAIPVGTSAPPNPSYTISDKTLQLNATLQD